jgi:hypothetical protein
MSKFVIEGNLPGHGTMPAHELAVTSATPNDVLATMAPHPQWVR